MKTGDAVALGLLVWLLWPRADGGAAVTFDWNPNPSELPPIIPTYPAEPTSQAPNYSGWLDSGQGGLLNGPPGSSDSWADAWYRATGDPTFLNLT